MPALSQQCGVVYGSKLSKHKNIVPPWLMPLLLLDSFNDFSDWNVQAKETLPSPSHFWSVLSQKQKKPQFLHFKAPWCSPAGWVDTDLPSHAPFTLLDWMHVFGLVHAWLTSFNGNYHMSSLFMPHDCLCAPLLHVYVCFAGMCV